jgi:hypothetical protein
MNLYLIVSYIYFIATLENFEGELILHIEKVDCALRDFRRCTEELKERIQEVCTFSISRVMLEFETGGNVRLEEGRPSDLWYTSCADLVQVS